MKKSTLFWVVGMIAAAGISVAVAVGALVYFTLRQNPSDPPTEAEKRLVVTAPILAEFGVEEVNPKCETYKITRHFDGSREIEYEYDSSKDPDADDTLLVISGAEINRTTSDAMQSFHLTVAAMKGGMMIGGRGAKLEAAPALLPLGDQRYSAYIKNARGTAGNIFVARHGRVLHSLIITGLYFDDADDVRQLFTPILEQSTTQFGSR